MNLLVKGTSGPLLGEVEVPNSKYHAHRALILASLAPGTSRIVGLSDARHVQFTMDVLRALGHENRSRRAHAAGNRRSLPCQAQGRFRRQFGIDALLHDRLGGARRRTDHADRTEIFPPASGRTAARGARGTRRKFRIRARLSADRRHARTATRRPHRHSRHALAMDLRPALARTVRPRTHRHRGRRRAQRASVYRTDGGDDARLRPARAYRARLAPLRSRAESAGASHDGRAAARYWFGRVRPCGHGDPSVRRALPRAARTARRAARSSRRRVLGDRPQNGPADGLRRAGARRARKARRDRVARFTRRLPRYPGHAADPLDAWNVREGSNDT